MVRACGTGRSPVRPGPLRSYPLPDVRHRAESDSARHPDLVFCIDVTLTEHEGRWLATAMLAEQPDIGTGHDPREALRAALAAPGEPFASELTASAELPA